MGTFQYRRRRGESARASVQRGSATLCKCRRLCARLAVGGRNELRRVFLQIALGANGQRSGPHFSLWSCREKRSAHVQHTRATFGTQARAIRGSCIWGVARFGLVTQLGHDSQRYPHPQISTEQYCTLFCDRVPSHYSGLSMAIVPPKNANSKTERPAEIRLNHFNRIGSYTKSGQQQRGRGHEVQ